MKQIFLLSMMCLTSFTFAQKKEYDQKIIGCYKGSEQNQQVDGTSKYWVSCRLDKGKSVLLFVAIDKDGKVTQTTENGNWWTNNGKYYELHNYDNVTDIYNYQILENGDVKFKSIELMGKEDSTYEFTDSKIEED
ncbi:hypothetical protein MP477_00660 [Chryseobacterium sp. WG23]|uniref:hypothetical protein n=1 Tax=Chryseobacterium sp. WG23 TaxID=2926910 RepID=UPI00211E7E02|nr:hypothetical protein [Chryseobacterium sp. WG23]MCQ9633459.1 hypothetical protein [Chryseobacterium sp. WG23]